MTANQGPGMRREEVLRGVIAQAILDVAVIEHEYDDFGPISHVGNEMDIADAILREIGRTHAVVGYNALWEALDEMQTNGETLGLWALLSPEYVRQQLLREIDATRTVLRGMKRPLDADSHE